MNKYQVGQVSVEYPDRAQNDSLNIFGNKVGGEAQRVLSQQSNIPIKLTVHGSSLNLGYGDEITHQMSVNDTMQLVAALQRAVNEYTDRVVYTSIEVSSISWD